MTESPLRGAGVAIEVRGLRKRYRSTMAVEDLSFTVEPGVVTGFVGPNGAGKSTTMRIILGLDAADGGTALIGGRPYRALSRPLRTVGALLDASAVHPGRSARNHLLWLARSNAIPRRRVEEVLDLAGLATVAKRTAGGFSLGMRQRLGIAAALLGDPAVVVFDEPINGLDVEGIQWIRSLLRSLAGEGRAVLVSSHLMSELEDSADHLLVIGRGRLLADASVRELVTTASGNRVAVRTGMRTEAVTVLANAGAPATITDGETVTVSGLTIERVIELLTRNGVRFTGVTAHRASLEEAYMELTRDAVEFGAASGSDGREAR